MGLIISSYFSKNGLPALGLSPTIRIWEVNEVSETLMISNELMSELSDGFYKYIFKDIDGYDESSNYVIRSFSEDNTMNNSERYSIASSGESNISQSTIDKIVDSTWDETATDHISSGTTGLLLNQIHADTSQLRIDNTLQISLLELLIKYESNKTILDKTNYTLTIFDDDGITPLTVFDLKDSTGQPSIVEICQRIPQ